MAQSLKEQLKEKDREIALLHSIARIVSTTHNLDEQLSKFSSLIVEQLKADSVLIYIFDENKEELILRGSHNPHPQQMGRIKLKLGEGITGWVAEKRKPVAIGKQANDDPRFKQFTNLPEDRYEAFLSVPITLKDELLGVLNVQHRKTHNHSAAEVQLAQHITEEIAEAIGHARVSRQAQKKTQAIQTLAKMSQTIAQGAYLREILQLIVTMTAEMMGSKICSLMLLDEKGKDLKIEATQSLSEEYKSKPPVSLKNSVSGRALLEKRPIVVADVAADPQYTYPDIARKENLRSLLVMPMMVKDKSIGVLNCYTSKIHPFTDEEVQLLQAVANQAAVAIEHTRAIEQAVAAQEALETRKVVERAKGILMRQQGLSEDAAFRLIQRQAMDRRKSMKEVAEALILSEEINKKK
jgi:signal transduction protein with GAF and PtsI domain